MAGPGLDLIVIILAGILNIYLFISNVNKWKLGVLPKVYIVGTLGISTLIWTWMNLSS